MNKLSTYLDFSARIIVFLTALLICAVLVLTGAREAYAASLRPVSVIEGATLTLGDIFDGLDRSKAAFVLGPAPQPGTEMTLNARTLLRIAMATDLSWRPVSVADQITLKSAATIIKKDLIKDKLAAALHDQGLDRDFEISFTHDFADMALPGKQVPQIEIGALKYDPQTDHFRATIAAPSLANPVVSREIAGRIERTISVPVLSQTLRHGDIIGAGDIHWIDMSEHDLQHNIILDESALIGMTPRRMGRSGKPLRDDEVALPRLVARGDTITIIYEEGPMVLTVKGRALQNGAKGEIIRVANVNSNRTIDAQVSGDRQVKVTAQ